MDADRKTALVAGALYIVTFVGSIPALALYHDILKDPNYILGHASDAGVRVSALLEIVCALAGIGTAVVLHRVVKRHAQTRALGFIASRVWEAAMICVGVMSVLAIVTLHHDATGASAGSANSLVGPARALVALHDWTFLVGPGLAPAISAMCLASVLYRTRLVPRIIPTLGLIGAPMLVVSSVATLFGVFDQVSSAAFVLALPIAVWEFSLGVWMLVKGFRPSPQQPESVPAASRNVGTGLVTATA
ncbi:MAG TPA: DUF4386 domain-containing protein [Acidimicrobiales bacterium]|nr:DUF4386 domain-containing protein [Acidimicrobiales bacterium]